MESPVKKSSLYPLKPILTPEDIMYPNYPLPTPKDVLQTQADTANLVEKRVPASDYTPEYLLKLEGYYRFYGTRHSTSELKTIKVIRETLEIV